MSSPRVLLAVALVISLSIAPVAGQSSQDYEITLDQEIDIPERTVEVESDEFTVSTTGRYAKGGTVEVTTSAPDSSEYAIRLVDSQERLRASAFAAGDNSTSFTLDYDAGTYAVVLANASDSSDIYAVKPLVIYGYTVTQETPDETEEDSTLTVEFSLTKADDANVDEPPANVRVALSNDSMSPLTTDATRTEDLHYTAEIDTNTLSPGDYRLSTGVQRDNTVYGEQELIGIDSYQVSIVEQTTTPTPTDDEATTTDSSGTSQSGSGAPSTSQSGSGAPSQGTQTTTATSTTRTVTTTPATSDSTQTPTSVATSSTDTSEVASTTTSESREDDDGTSPQSQSTNTTSSPAGEDGGSSTPVSTPVLPDSGVLALGLVIVTLLSRLR
jgi:hypothetical protein